MMYCSCFSPILLFCGECSLLLLFLLFARRAYVLSVCPDLILLLRLLRLTPLTRCSPCFRTSSGTPFFFDAQRFTIMPADGDRSRVDDSCHGVERFTVGTWFKRWKHCVVRGCVIRSDGVVGVDMPFIRCSEEFTYALRLATIVDKFASELSV